MPYNNIIPPKSDTYRPDHIGKKELPAIYWGEVVSIDDSSEAGRIKVRVDSLDDGNTPTELLEWTYPMLPKYFYALPQVNEAVLVFVEDLFYTGKKRYWIGSSISQLQKIGRETYASAIRTNQYLPAHSTYPDAKGVYPEKDDIGIIGRVNTDILLKLNQVQFRAGKHEPNNPLKINAKNPATFNMYYEPISITDSTKVYESRSIIMSDKIGLISHEGNPKFKAINISNDDRTKIFETGHPIARGDVLVEALKILRNAIVNHIHGYNSLPADKNALIQDLEKIDFDGILQKNIVTN